MLLIAFMVSCGFGVGYDCVRILFFTYGFLFIIFDRIAFNFKIFLTLFSFSLVAKLVFKYSAYSGHKVEKNLYIRIVYLACVVIFSVLNVYTYYPAYVLDEFGYYSYMVEPNLRYIIYFVYLPLCVLVLTQTGLLLKEVKNKQYRKELFFAIIPLALIVLERLQIMGYSYPGSGTINRYIIDYLFILIIMICLCIFILKYPDFFEAVSSYFSVKSIYLIKKNGILIYQYDFREEQKEFELTSRQLLIGGFIYTLTSGLKKTFNVGDIDSINVGDITLIFKYGEHILGILFLSEYTAILEKKLSMFIDIFEFSYQEELKNWKGDVTIYEKGRLTNWITEIFR